MLGGTVASPGGISPGQVGQGGVLGIVAESQALAIALLSIFPSWWWG